MKHVLFGLLVVAALGSCSKDLFYTARPDIKVSLYLPNGINRSLKNYSYAAYLNYYSDDELYRFLNQELKYWEDSLGYKARIIQNGDAFSDDSSDYVVRITEYSIKEDKYNRQVSQPATTSSPKMSATVKVRQVTIHYAAVIHSNLNGTSETVTGSVSDEENISAGYFQPTSTLSSTSPTYNYICDIIPMELAETRTLTRFASRSLVHDIDRQIHKVYRKKLKAEKRRQKQLMKAPAGQ